jgi:hypothetical protein
MTILTAGDIHEILAAFDRILGRFIAHGKQHPGT